MENNVPMTRDSIRREAIQMTLRKWCDIKEENWGVAIENVMSNLKSLDKLKGSRENKDVG